MVYMPRAIGSALCPKLLGCYECELAEVMARILETPYATIVDVGCAEGYYAVGLALRMPEARVYAFDTDARARELCEEMARSNGVADRVVVGGMCDPERLRELPLASALLISDCEGYELELLRPDLVPGLRQCDVLVELHDGRDPRITPALRERFAATHEIAWIASVERDPAQYPALQFLRPAERTLAVCEFRSPQKWAFMTVRGERKEYSA
jgi:hypothetical protein